VLTVITDNINMSPTDGVYATVVSATDYYPFGLAMAGRRFSNDSYRYGFNDKEKNAMGMPFMTMALESTIRRLRSS